MAKEVLKKFGASGKESYSMVTLGVLKKIKEKNVTKKLNKHFIYMQHFQWLMVLKPHLHSILSSNSKTRIILLSVK